MTPGCIKLPGKAKWILCKSEKVLEAHSTFGSCLMMVYIKLVGDFIISVIKVSLGARKSLMMELIWHGF